jgi:hypothetical protein
MRQKNRDDVDVEQCNDDPVSDEMDELGQIEQTIDQQFKDMPRGSIIDDTNDGEDRPPGDQEPNTIYAKYRTEAEVNKRQKPEFNPYVANYGRHVALTNMPRSDNPRHLNWIDLQYMYDDEPMLAQHGNMIRIRETAEFQMCRGNPEIGGFEAKIGSTIIKRESVDVKQSQSLEQNISRPKKKNVLAFWRK